MSLFLPGWCQDDHDNIQDRFRHVGHLNHKETQRFSLLSLPLVNLRTLDGAQDWSVVSGKGASPLKGNPPGSGEIKSCAK